MRVIFAIIGLLVSINAVAQFSDTTSIPKEWKNESLILLHYEISYKLNVEGKSEEEVRIVYYLRDKWALDEVSQINLPSTVEGTYSLTGQLGVVHKKNGTKKDIGTDHLIPKKVSLDFNSNSKNKNLFTLEIPDGNKLAVPFVEVGDILELKYKFNISNFPTIIPLVSQFSILNYEVGVRLETTSTYYSSYYGTYYIDPTIKNSSLNFATKENSYFSIKTTNIKHYKEEILNDNLTQIPYVLITYPRQGSKDSNTEFKKMSETETQVDQMAKVKSIYYDGDKEERQLANTILSKLKKKHSVITDTMQFIDDAYYYYRESIAGEYGYMGYTRGGYKNDFFFVNVMGRVFTAKKINYKAFVSQENHFGGVSKNADLLAPVYGIEIPGKKKYLFNPLYNLEPNNIPSYFENQNYIAFDASKYYKKAKFKWYPILIGLAGYYIYRDIAATNIRNNQSKYINNNPNVGGYYTNEYYEKIKSNERNSTLIFLSGVGGSVGLYIGQNASYKKKRRYGYEEKTFISTPAEKNKAKNEITIENLAAVDNQVKVSSKNYFFGKMRVDELRKLANYSNAYYEKENEYTKNLNYTPSEKQSEEDKKKEEKRMKKVFLNDLRDEDFDVQKVHNYTIEKANFFNTEEPVQYTVDFNAKNLVTTSDNYIIVNAGRLIGSQLEVNETSADRTQDFYIPYQKQFERVIKIKIPNGYTALNLNEFVSNKKTSAGEFVTTAVIDGGYVKINTKKTYAFQSYFKEDASDIYDFLNEASSFLNKKLILKKN